MRTEFNNDKMRVLLKNAEYGWVKKGTGLYLVSNKNRRYSPRMVKPVDMMGDLRECVLKPVGEAELLELHEDLMNNEGEWIEVLAEYLPQNNASFWSNKKISTANQTINNKTLYNNE